MSKNMEYVRSLSFKTKFMIRSNKKCQKIWNVYALSPSKNKIQIRSDKKMLKIIKCAHTLSLIQNSDI